MTRKKMLFRLPTADEEGWPPATIEGIWVVPRGDRDYQVDNIPFFVKGVSWLDIVTGTMKNGELWFEKVAAWGGHRTLRVIVFDASQMATVLADLHTLGCGSEVSHLPQLAAVDIPPKIDPAPVRALLRAGREKGTMDYEEANVDW
jgi:hypothetical protein